MSVKSLRLAKGWSQDQLAQLSDLNVRTIQRVEKGEKVGLETLNALAAVLEVTVDQINPDCINQADSAERENSVANESLKNEAKEKVNAIRQFYMSSGFLVMIFVLFMLPNYNGGENLEALIGVFVCFVGIIIGHAYMVFQPFGDKWQQDKVEKLLKQDAEKK